MRWLLLIFLSFFIHVFFGQSICNPSGNLIVYSNYDGGILNINVNQNIPNLKIGICTYEPIQVNIYGVFANNVTQVVYAGFNASQNNNNCLLGNFSTTISGVPSSITTINNSQNPPLVGYTPQHGNGAGPWGGFMIGASGLCDTNQNSGGANTPDEIIYYFQMATASSLRYHFSQYNCWMNDELQVSNGGNCCIIPPNQCNSSFGLDASIIQTTCNQNNGAINLTIDNSNPTTFLWVPSISNSNFATNLNPGNYSIIISQNNCTLDTAFEILSSQGISGSINLITTASCFDNNGALEISNVLGGQAPYLYELGFNTPQLNPVFMNLCADLYTLIITDSNNCQFQSNVFIPDIGNPTFAIVNYYPSQCANEKTELEIIGIVGGNGPYIYEIDQIVSNTQTWNLTPGLHLIHIIDANGCEHFQDIDILNHNISNSLFIPNVFTPNKDGINDIWCVNPICYEWGKGIILNRWGEELNYFNFENPCWNGNDLKGKECEDGVYFYQINYMTFEGKIGIETGNITKIK